MLSKLLEMSCKKATFLASKNQENKISFPQRLKMNFHLKICDSCSSFVKQTVIIEKKAAQIDLHNNMVLRPEKKQQIKELIELQK